MNKFLPRVLPILDRKNPVLHEKAKTVALEKIDSAEIQNLIDNMFMTLGDTPDGVGLAAPQVGISLRLFIVKTVDYMGVFINPEVMSKDERAITGEEGCLSVRGLYGFVKRFKSIKVKAVDRNGKTFKFRAKGFVARILQHELDHLDGVLFADKAEKVYSHEHGEV